MLSVGDRFARVAEHVCEQIPELIQGPVFVTDEDGVVLASNEPGSLGRLFEGSAANPSAGFLHVPLHVDGHGGQVIVSPGDGAAAVPAEFLRRAVELAVRQSIVVTRVARQPEARAQFLDDLLRGDFSDEGTARREALFAGLTFQRPYGVLVFDAGAYVLTPFEKGDAVATEQRVQRRVIATVSAINSYFHLPSDGLVAHLGRGEIAVLVALPANGWGPPEERAAGQPLEPPELRRVAEDLLERLQREERGEVTAGMGLWRPGILGLAASYNDAITALELGRAALGPNAAYSLPGLGLIALLGASDAGTKHALARSLLAPIAEDHELLHTLDAFFSHDTSPSLSSKALAVHRNTLTYRLERIAALTGVDPPRFEGAARLRAARILMSMEGVGRLHNRGAGG
jgi:carbohydrate diacid regulator